MNWSTRTSVPLLLAFGLSIPHASADVLRNVCHSSTESVQEMVADPLLRRFFEQTCGIQLTLAERSIESVKQSDRVNSQPEGLSEEKFWEAQAAPDSAGISSADPWLYAMQDLGLGDVEMLATPTLLIPDWKQGLKLAPSSDWKPPSIHPQSMGIFLELSAQRYAEDGRPTRLSALPSVGVHFRDERVISSPSRYFGLSGNLDLSIGYTEFSRGGENRNVFQRLQTEGYLPIGHSGLYWGLGYRRVLDNAGPGFDRAGFPEIDRLSEYQYLPIGWVSQSLSGRRTKIQFNHLLRGDQTDFFSQIPGYSGRVQTRQKDGFGADLSVSGMAGLEFFARYWKLQASRPGGLTVDGLGVEMRTESNETIELGVRKQLR